MRTAALLLALAGCGGGLPADTVRVSPLQPPDVDPLVGFGARTLVEANTARETAVVHLELFHGGRMDLRREIGRAPFASPMRATFTTDTSGPERQLFVELVPCDAEGAPVGDARTLNAPFPDDFPAKGGLLSPVMTLDPSEHPDDAFAPLFGVRRGGTISFTGPAGPFGSDEIVLRVVVRLE